MDLPITSRQSAEKTCREIVASIVSSILEATPKEASPLNGAHYHENYGLYQPECYQQFSPNLCGYHAIFNTFCFLKALQGGNMDYNIKSAASFWRFKLKVEAFLFSMKKKYRIANEWPWRDKDILDGDFERTYNKICLQRFQEFSVFHSSPSFEYLTHNWMFQYQNLLLESDSRNELTTKFEYFRKYKEEKPLVLHLMMGVTTHWVTFLAVKSKGQAQFWFIDSHNHHHLDYSWQNIVQFIAHKSKERTKYGKPEFTNFQKESYAMCIKDIQTSLKLIIDCLKGRQTLESYTYNQKLSLFAEPLQAAIAVDYESVCIVVKEYQHNMRSFFIDRVQWQLLSQTNNALMKEIVQYSARVKNLGNEGRFLYSLTQKVTSSL